MARHVNMGDLDRPPNPQRSVRPGEAVAHLGTVLHSRALWAPSSRSSTSRRIF